MSLTESLPRETIEKLVGSSIKIGPGRTANGHIKDGPTIGKLVRLAGNQAIVLPKGHKREEAIDLDRVCIWKKGLKLNHKSDREIAEILGEEATPDLADPEYREPPVSRRKPEVEGIFVIKHSDGTYYVKAGHDTEEQWTIYLDDATVYETQGGAKRAISRRSKSVDRFYECEVVDAEKETPLTKQEDTLAGSSESPAPVSAIDQMAQLCAEHRSAQARLEQLERTRASLDAQIEQAKAQVEAAAIDIRAAAELMVGE